MDLGDFGFRAWSALVIVALVPIVAIMAARGRALRTRELTRLGIADTHRRTIAKWLIPGIAITLLSIAVLRPYWGSETITVKAPASTTIFLTDVSRSMFAQDVSPSRMDVARRKMLDLLSTLGRQGHSSRFGITLFAGAAYTVCPITSDQAVVKQFISIVSPELVTSLGSNLNAGIETALSGIDVSANESTRVILITDGEDATLDELNLVKKIRERGIRFDVLGVGTPTGAAITLPNGSKVLDRDRNPVTSRLNEAALQRLANAGGGVYARVTLDDSDIQTLTRASVLPRASSSGEESAVTSFREFGSWLALAALAVILAGVALRGPGAIGICLVMLIAIPLRSQAQQPSQGLFGGASQTSPYHLYEMGEFEKSAQAFTEALKHRPGDQQLTFGLASALFKSGKFSESRKLFNELASQAADGRLYFESTYNEGNALLALKRYQEAIDAYTKALDVKPGDTQAEHNLAVARALHEEEKNRPRTPAPTPTPSPQPSSQPSPEPSSQPSPSPSPQDSGEPTPENSPSPDSGSETATPQPNADQTAPGTPSPDESGSPSGTATPDPNSTSPENDSSVSPTPDDHSDDDQESMATPQSNGGPPTPMPEQNVTEADAWLESLPDAPPLASRYQGESKLGGQSW